MVVPVVADPTTMGIIHPILPVLTVDKARW
jgi:hypothetical protein